MATNGGSTNSPAPTAGDAYGELIKEQLQEERNRKSSVEQRGIAVITTSGVLVSLLLGLAAVVTASKQFVLPGVARVLLLLSLPCFMTAAVLGIRANLPMRYQEAGPEGLRRILEYFDWSKEVAAIKAHTMLVFADADAVRTAHIVEFFGLLGGGQRDAGMDGSARPRLSSPFCPASRTTPSAPPQRSRQSLPFLAGTAVGTRWDTARVSSSE